MRTAAAPRLSELPFGIEAAARSRNSCTKKNTPLPLLNTATALSFKELWHGREYGEVTKLVGAIIYSQTQHGGREKGPPRHTHHQRLRHVLSVGVYLLRKLLRT
jgi:hypothetical protein